MRVAAISAHTDDVELGAGGALARRVREGATVFVVALSLGARQQGAHLEEFNRAMAALGIKETMAMDYPGRRFQEHRQEILDALITLREAFLPDVVLVPSTADAHQDHQVVTAEALRAFRGVTLLGYESPWSNIAPVHLQHFVTLEPRDLEAKVRAVGCYETQARRPYAKPEFIRALAAVRGVQAGAALAEAFEVLRSRE